MWWILFGLFLVVMIGRVVGNAGKGKDDFAGNSMESNFLLEEFIDEPSREDDEPDQSERFGEQEEEDWFEDEFE